MGAHHHQEWGAIARKLLGAFAQTGGATAVIFALTLPVLVGFMGLGAETGYWFFRQRQLQTAADLGAYAGAVALRNGEDSSVAETAAGQEVARFNLNATGSVQTNSPPLSGTHEDNQSMEVLISENEQRYFSAAFISTPVALKARAVATYQSGSPACILALDKSAGKSIWFQGSSDTTLLGCEVMSNSVASNAVEVDGSAVLSTSCINSVGGVALNNSNVTLTDCAAPRINMSPAQDPFSSVANPPVTNCIDQPSTSGSGPFHLSPACYTNGLTLQGTYLLAPGVYVIDGGTFKINSGADVSIDPGAPLDPITGDGIVFYLTNHASLSFNGNATINLKAPTDGPYKGILFLADDSTEGPGDAVTINGDASSILVGALYFPTQVVSFTGNYSSLYKCIALVADQIQLTGNEELNSDCTTNGNVVLPQVPGRVELVE